MSALRWHYRGTDMLGVASWIASAGSGYGEVWRIANWNAPTRPTWFVCGRYVTADGPVIVQQFVDSARQAFETAASFFC